MLLCIGGMLTFETGGREGRCQKWSSFDYQNRQKRGIFIIIFFYVCTGFYIVHPSEEGIELTFGKYSNTEAPGLRFPYPIGKFFSSSADRRPSYHSPNDC